MGRRWPLDPPVIFQGRRSGPLVACLTIALSASLIYMRACLSGMHQTTT